MAAGGGQTRCDVYVPTPHPPGRLLDRAIAGSRGRLFSREPRPIWGSNSHDRFCWVIGWRDIAPAAALGARGLLIPGPDTRAADAGIERRVRRRSRPHWPPQWIGFLVSSRRSYSLRVAHLPDPLTIN